MGVGERSFWEAEVVAAAAVVAAVAVAAVAAAAVAVAVAAAAVDLRGTRGRRIPTPMSSSHPASAAARHGRCGYDCAREPRPGWPQSQRGVRVMLWSSRCLRVTS